MNAQNIVGGAQLLTRMNN